VALETHVIPQLIAAMFNDTNDSRLRLVLIENLNALPGVNITDDTADMRRSLAAATLGQFGPRAQAAIPSLVKVVKSQDAAAREAATRALGQIRCQPDETIPLLITCLDDPQDGVPEAAAEALGDFGNLAKAAVPKLVPWLKGREKDRVHAAMVALPKIDRAAALEAGIK
jgi:HEAT repeat protein